MASPGGGVRSEVRGRAPITQFPPCVADEEPSPTSLGVGRDHALNSTVNSPIALTRAIADAHTLTDMGVPVFSGRLNGAGDPDVLDPRWNGWHKYEPSHARVGRYRPGEAMCAVTGIVYDVLDVDPRNGGQLSLKQLSRALGDAGPETYWAVRTASGGQHLYIAPLCIGSRKGFMPGLDLKGGKPDGTSRGFVFIPPTVRPSKDSGTGAGVRTGYVALRELEPPDDGVIDALSAFILSHDGPGPAVTVRERSRRVPADSLRGACLVAEPGTQRDALLAYVHELERRGFDEGEILTLLRALVGEMPAYDERHPWFPVRGRDPEAELKGLLHQRGSVVPDGGRDEVAGLSRNTPRVSGLVRPLSGLVPTQVSWIWPGYLAIRELTAVDGEKGKAKTFVTDDIAARVSRGRAMPGCAESVLPGPANVIIFTDEGHAESVTLPRLMAADADLSRVFIPGIKVPRRGEKSVDWNLELPDGASVFGDMIREAGAVLAIFDPITDFLGVDVRTHNDASFRRALRPLAIELTKTECGGWAIRHMNKDTSALARNRGSGAASFQNRARVHLICGDMPDSYKLSGVPGDYGLAMIDANMAKKVEGVLPLSVVDSDIPMDDQGNMVGRVEWHSLVDIDPNVLVMGDKRQMGPKETPAQDLIYSVLWDLFHEKHTWRRKEVMEALLRAGCNMNDTRTLQKVKARLRIRSVRIYRPGRKGIERVDWTTRKQRVSDDD